MGGTYQNSTSSTAATFTSPTVVAGETAFLVQFNTTNEAACGDPTWDGETMTLGVKIDGGAGGTRACGLWYLDSATINAGATTIARGTNVNVCVALTASGVALGASLAGDPDSGASEGAGSRALSCINVLVPDFLVSVAGARFGTNVALSGDQTAEIYNAIIDDEDISVAYTNSPVVAGTVDQSFNWTGNLDNCGVAMAFGGQQVKSHSIMKLFG